MKPTLLILAAGMASRYGSMKQIDGFGPSDETIIDYSIYDAIKAGFGKVVFVVKREMSDRFREIFDQKLRGHIETDYVYQGFDLEKYGIDKEVLREKPWGTGHAVLESRDKIHEPFCVINADDFYGHDAFEKMASFLTGEVKDDYMSLMGYRLDKTLSDNGTVSRGVCEVDGHGHMTAVNERTTIYWKEDGERKIVYEEDGVETELAPDRRVSMNFWGFTPRVFDVAEELFKEFVAANEQRPKAEFYIPKVADYLAQTGKAIFKVIPTSEKWFGVTYAEDKEQVKNNIAKLVDAGVYPEKLF